MKVWIASRHASLAVAMTGAEILFFNSLLENAAIKACPREGGDGSWSIAKKLYKTRR